MSFAEGGTPVPLGAIPGPWPAGFGAGRREREALLVLATLESLHPRRLLELALERGSARACLQAVLEGAAASPTDRRRARNPGLGGVPAIEEALRACSARMVTPADAEYPPGLGDLSDPPATLFVRGGPIVPDGVAVVGARSCSPLGREVARSLGRAIAASGVPVVSGAARGIDSSAHHGALDAGGPTIAVLGSGIDRPYPSTNRRMLEAIERTGCVLSEYPPGIAALPFRFPARNRIIAALSRAAVVVEGEEGSGSMITVDHALELGRAVFAVPGPVTSSLSHVPLQLLRDGATLIRGGEDLLIDLGVRSIEEAGGTGRHLGLSEEDRALLDALPGPTLPDEAASRLRWDLRRVVAALVDLEIRGLVRGRGGRFEPTLAGRR